MRAYNLFKAIRPVIPGHFRAYGRETVVSGHRVRDGVL